MPNNPFADRCRPQRPFFRAFALCALLAVTLLETACGGGGAVGTDSASAASADLLRSRGGYGGTATEKLTVTAPTGGTITGASWGINCGTSCEASVAAGTSVTLTAAPATGHAFTGWSGACAGTSATCTLAMSAAKAVSANFSATSTSTSSGYALTLVDAGTGSGTVTSSAGGFSCTSGGTCTAAVCSAGTCTAPIAAGTSITLTAAPASGYTFSGWSGACTGTSTTCTWTVAASANVTATFTASSACSPTGASSLASVITNSSGTTTTNTEANGACPNDPTYGKVWGLCYGNYAVQVNEYATPPASTNFSMWSQSGSCWGINVTEATNTNSVYWNAPEDTRGFAFTGYNAPLTATGGMLVSALNTQHAAASTPCPASGPSSSVCAKWAMSVPGVAPQSAINTASTTYGRWDALLDIYFHSTATVAAYATATFDLQIYQMVMDNEASNGVPNWAANLLGTYTTKTISGVTYLVSVNMQNPGTEGASGWVGNGGTLNEVSMFPLPTYPTTKPAGSGSFLWGSSSMVNDVGGIIAWLSQPQTINGVTAIFDDAGKPLYDNVRKANVTSPLIDPSTYLSGLNAGYEVVQATPSTTYPNNTVFTTTNFWVALPGEAVGN